jgi:hypothetical protein
MWVPVSAKGCVLFTIIIRLVKRVCPYSLLTEVVGAGVGAGVVGAGVGAGVAGLGAGVGTNGFSGATKALNVVQAGS